MISVGEAAEKAADFARGVLDEDRSRNLRLEEVELEQSTNRWLITLSMAAVSAFGEPSVK